MSWPGGDEPFPDSTTQGDRPTDLASLGKFSTKGHLLGFTRDQVEQTLKLLSRPFDDLPQLPPFAPLFGYTTAWHKMEVARVILDMSGHVGRLPTPDEADALAYYRSKFCSAVSWSPPAVLLTTVYFTNRGRAKFRFPFYTPKPASFNPNYFPFASRPVLSGPLAVRIWHVLRFCAYGILCQFLVKSTVVSYATSTSLLGMLRDDRLKVMRQTPRQASGQVGHQPQQQYGRQDAAQTPDESRGQPQQQTSPQLPTWRRPARERPAQESQGTPQEDDSFLFDDASPVAPSQRQQPQRSSASPTQLPTQGSAWDRIRQQAKSEEGAQYYPGQQQSGQSQGQQYTYSSSEQEKAYAKEQAQKEFDAMLERERRGVGESGGRS